MNNLIKVKIKSHYGKNHFYPSCEMSKSLAKLCETKTLTPEKLSIIKKEMGFNIELINDVNLPDFE